MSPDLRMPVRIKIIDVGELVYVGKRRIQIRDVLLEDGRTITLTKGDALDAYVGLEVVFRDGEPVTLLRAIDNPPLNEHERQRLIEMIQRGKS